MTVSILVLVVLSGTMTDQLPTANQLVEAEPFQNSTAHDGLVDAMTSPSATVVAVRLCRNRQPEEFAMRALRWPDAFPRRDVAVLKRLGGVSAGEAERLSQAWRPWRSYAVLHLWRRSGG